MRIKRKKPKTNLRMPPRRNPQNAGSGEQAGPHPVPNSIGLGTGQTAVPAPVPHIIERDPVPQNHADGTVEKADPVPKEVKRGTKRAGDTDLCPMAHKSQALHIGVTFNPAPILSPDGRVAFVEGTVAKCERCGGEWVGKMVWQRLSK